MKLSVIIPCFNVANTIALQLNALAKQHWSDLWEVIVSDNGSTDETLAIVAQYQKKLPNLRIVDASDQRGAAHARNIGAWIAMGDGLAFCDADDEVAPGWVAAMGDALSKYDFVAGRRDYEKLNEPWAIKSCRLTQIDELQKSSFLPFASSCSLGVKRSIHNAVGGFDTTMLRLQDIDYCWKIQLAGTKLQFVPDAVVHYRLRPTIAALYRQGHLIGKYQVLLYKKYKALGKDKLSWQEGVRAWVLLLKRLPQLFSQEDRAKWVTDFARRVGRLQGCIDYRILAL